MTSLPQQTIVLDTNIMLDAFVFSDVAAIPVRDGLESGVLRWIATQPMRDELQRDIDAFCASPYAIVQSVGS